MCKVNIDFNIYVSVLFLLVIIAISVVVGISLKQGTVIESKGKSAYIRNRKASPEMKRRERESMEALDNGEIKCQLLRNNAKPHDVGKWVGNMKEFMSKPIYKQLLLLEGNDLDGEN